MCRLGPVPRCSESDFAVKERIPTADETLVYTWCVHWDGMWSVGVVEDVFAQHGIQRPTYAYRTHARRTQHRYPFACRRELVVPPLVAPPPPFLLQRVVCGRPDASLRELVNCVKETCEEARQPNVRLSLAFVYTDAKGEVHMRNVGVLHTSKRGRDDDKILRTLRFQTGDFLDCAVLTAL